MEPERLAEFCQARHGSLLAPAGCGKTETIAHAVRWHQERDESTLVLTHTHAGVSAIESRLRQGQGGSSRRVRVETIAGWCLRFGASYPSISGLKVDTPTGPQWDEVYEAATRVASSPVRRVISASYAAVYVDEYQDCTQRQHALIRALAQAVPCKVLGDPLQGIFCFGDNELVAWDEVEAVFPPFPRLSTPWRWASTNPKLGNWLAEARLRLEAGEPLSLRGAPVEWRSLPSDQWRSSAQLRVAKEIGQRAGSTVCIMQWPSQCNGMAQKLGGAFSVMEPMESEDLTRAAAAIGGAAGADRIDALLAFAAKCMTGVNDQLKTIAEAAKAQRATRSKKHPAQRVALEAMARDDSPSALLAALEAVRETEGTTLYRRELYDALEGATRAWTGEGSLAEAAWETRNQARKRGRSTIAGNAISRTLLVKGLQYDHVAILDADCLDRRNLYVALTRARRTLTVMSKDVTLCPSG